MTIRTYLAGAALAILGFAATGAQAATIYSNPTPTGDMDTNAPAVVDTFTAAGGAAQASFIIDGYASLDGQNFYEDDFTLSLNGTPIVTGTFNLGGGGANVVYTAPMGTSAINLSGLDSGQITFTGGQELVWVPITLAAGANSLSFSYTSLTDGHAGFQGIGDEGWGVEQVLVANAVPEPATWAIMLVGFGGLGGALRAARRGKARLAA
jgi:hypothetical protein